MPARSKRLAGPITPPLATPTVLYTVPAGITALVKVIFAVNESGLASSFDGGIGGVATGQRWVRNRVVPANGSDKQSIDDDRPLVLNAGEQLVVSTVGASLVSYSVCGAELEA